MVAWDEGGHLPWSFQAKDIGLVLDGDDLLGLVGVDGEICDFFIGIVPEVAIELGPEEIGDELGYYCLVFIGRGWAG